MQVLGCLQTKKCRCMLANGNFHKCSPDAKCEWKILVCKQWGLGYQRFSGNKHDKKHKNTHQNTYKEIQNDQIKKDDITSIKNMFTNLSPA